MKKSFGLLLWFALFFCVGVIGGPNVGICQGPETHSFSSISNDGTVVHVFDLKTNHLRRFEFDSQMKVCSMVYTHEIPSADKWIEIKENIFIGVSRPDSLDTAFSNNEQSNLIVVKANKQKEGQINGFTINSPINVAGYAMDIAADSINSRVFVFDIAPPPDDGAGISVFKFDDCDLKAEGRLLLPTDPDAPVYGWGAPEINLPDIAGITQSRKHVFFGAGNKIYLWDISGSVVVDQPIIACNTLFDVQQGVEFYSAKMEVDVCPDDKLMVCSVGAIRDGNRHLHTPQFFREDGRYLFMKVVDLATQRESSLVVPLDDYDAFSSHFPVAFVGKNEFLVVTNHKILLFRVSNEMKIDKLDEIVVDGGRKASIKSIGLQRQVVAWEKLKSGDLVVGCFEVKESKIRLNLNWTR